MIQEQNSEFIESKLNENIGTKFHNLTNIEVPSQVIENVIIGGKFSYPITEKDKPHVVFNLIKEFEGGIF